MKIEDISRIQDEESRVKATYNFFDESTRLLSKATQVEFLTTIRQIEKYLTEGMKILDIGAGTGEYSVYFAENGYDVTAVELVEEQLTKIKNRIKPGMNLKAFQGNVLNLSMIEDESFDIVLCFGPLYHLASYKDRTGCIEEVKRVCKVDGLMYFAFISNDMVIATETICRDPDFLKSNKYNPDTFDISGILFVFHTVDECRQLLKESNLSTRAEVAADGLSELLADKINAMDDHDYNMWLKYHYYCCEKPEFLGASNHLLFIAQK